MMRLWPAATPPAEDQRVDSLEDDKHLQMLKPGVGEWDVWRKQWDVWRRQIPSARTELSGADLNGADLGGADLSETDLTGADLSGVDLIGADLSKAHLGDASLSGADLSEAILMQADLSGAILQVDEPLQCAIWRCRPTSGRPLSRRRFHDPWSLEQNAPPRELAEKLAAYVSSRRRLLDCDHD